MPEDRYHKLQAVILRNRDYKEHDKLVDLFSLEAGRQTLLARGASRPTGSLRGLVQPFVHAELTVAKGRGSLNILTQGAVERPFISLRQDLHKIIYASYVAELVLSAMPENKPSVEVFRLLLATYALLDMDADRRLAARFFELGLLDALGLRPRLDDCLSCGRGIAGAFFYVSPAQGGLLCASCNGGGGPLISAGAVMTLRQLRKSPLTRLPQLKISPAIARELDEALSHYLAYHLERASKARALLRQLEEDEG